MAKYKIENKLGLALSYNYTFSDDYLDSQWVSYSESVLKETLLELVTIYNYDLEDLIVVEIEESHKNASEYMK